jgi:hypothetical protein
MKRMSGIILIIGGIFVIAIGTFLTIYGQYSISKSDNENISNQNTKLLDQNTKFSDQNTKLIDKVSHYQTELDEKDKKIRELERWGNKISIRFMESLYQSMTSFLGTIQEYSTTRIDDFSKESFKVLCKGCDLDQHTKILKSFNPYTYYKLRDYLLYNWTKINEQLRDINSASTYIPPKAYELFLRIKDRGNPINILSVTTNKNTDLEAWSSTFFDIYNLSIELKELMKEIENTNK